MITVQVTVFDLTNVTRVRSGRTSDEGSAGEGGGDESGSAGIGRENLETFGNP